MSRRIEAIDEAAWVPILYPNEGGAHVAEALYTAFAADHVRRGRPSRLPHSTPTSCQRASPRRPK